MNWLRGTSKTIALKLNEQDFSFWDPSRQDWYAEPGTFVIHVGSSLRDLHLKAQITH
ncbi:MAG: fibronectin type III-like domain-contianing protein [candidate division KSB1 bacterium]|nr:fibronectin type III-like domain-contianing protein [candidate division KSB1 bacterium]